METKTTIIDAMNAYTDAKAGQQPPQPPAPPIFTNGFTNWYETFYEVAAYIASIESDRVERHMNGVIHDTLQTHGHGGLYELCHQWTNDFEELNAGREWDGEFFDEIEEFLNAKNDAR